MLIILECCFSMNDQEATGNFEFYLILCMTFSTSFSQLLLNSFPLCLTKMTGHYCVAKNASRNHVNFKTFNIRQIVHKAKWPLTTQVLYFS